MKEMSVNERNECEWKRWLWVKRWVWMNETVINEGDENGEIYIGSYKEIVMKRFCHL